MSTTLHECHTKEETVADAIAADLRMNILHGMIKAGTKLREEELSKRYNSSRTPVREAFRILQYENLISYSPFVGVTASRITRKFMEDTWALLCLLERHAAELSVFNATEEELLALRGLRDKILSLHPEDLNGFILTNSQFHLILGKLSGNRELEKAVARNWGSIRSYQILAFEQNIPSRLTHASHEHARVIQAIIDRDIERTREHLQEHLDNSWNRNERCIV
jgi:DNA-binding GntR family transcriptional regulator